jgi:hypothetical protein
MKRSISVLPIILSLLVSCSTDKDKSEDPISAIEGSWAATELQVDEETASENSKFGAQILDYLTENNCVVLTFTFKSDLTVEANNSANYIEVNGSSSGLEIQCPTQSDFNLSTYTFDGAILTTVDEDGQTVALRATVNDNILSINAADLDIPNFNDEGELLFVKQ